MKESGWQKIIFDKMTAVIIPLYGFCICMNSAFMGWPPTTAFDGEILYFSDTM